MSSVDAEVRARDRDAALSPQVAVFALDPTALSQGGHLYSKVK